MTELDLFGPGPEPAPRVAPGALAAVAPEAPVEGPFTYLVPEELLARALPGVRVRVPFGGRVVRGYLIERPAETDVDPARLRPLVGIMDPEPVVTPEVLELARWAARYYRASLGEVLAAAVPRAVGEPPRARPPAWARLLAAPPDGLRLGKVQRRALELLAPGPRPVAALQEAGVGRDVLRRLAERGLLELTDLAEEAAAEAPPAAPPELTFEQQAALAPLLRQIEASAAGTTLLFGITGSGKTEVYLRAIARVLELGRSAIVLVPEIALTPQTLARFQARFGERVAVLHSQLSGSDRRGEWHRVFCGEARVVIGPRSAVWAPVRDLGLIVVDEEHETTYKQEGSPRYHARDLAVVRGEQAGAPVLLGSATPALESYQNAVRGRYRMARLTRRPGASALPETRVVDMGREWAEVKGAPLLSRVLIREVGRALARGERALLFQNRRGFTTFLQCRVCGHVLKCRDCDISLTFHRSEGACLCHFCDFRAPPPGGPCPACEGPPLTQRGAGTERIEEVVRACFPEARVGRLDTDVVRGGATPEEVIDRFRRGELTILIGTQMIAKGLDIPEVTVVGVISADTSLTLPDFRASERSFQLIAQVAGRAGRGERPGITVVQTFTPDHFAIETATQHRYEPFAAAELEARRALDYPPFARLVKALWRGPREEEVRAEAERACAALRAAPEGFTLLGPAPSPRAYLAQKFRWQALVKGDAAVIRRAIARLEAERPRGDRVQLILDVDPVHLL